MPPPSEEATESANHKSAIRSQVWTELRKVARPDSRFHYDFSSFIADFDGSQRATDRLLAMPEYRDCDTVFIAPDNCLEYLREQTLRAGIRILITTYGIRRGFWLLDPAAMDPALYRYAATLDGMERVAAPVDVVGVASEQRLRVGFMVTGTGAINHEGVRFGKGHGYFDLEWGMLFDCGVISANTLAAALVHDYQVLDRELRPDVFDTVCDFVVTPSRLIRVPSAVKPTCGILWHRLEAGMLDDIPPLRSLKKCQESGSQCREMLKCI